MDKQEAYQYGYDNGFGIGRENRSDSTDKDEYLSACLVHESDAFRQYSTFEFFASDVNDSEDPDSLWDAYESGVYDGIQDAW